MEEDTVREINQLNRLRAPQQLTDSILAILDLGDRYLSIDSPVGPIMVAYNQRGVVLILRAEDHEFEQEFMRRFGRRVVPAEDLRLRRQLETALQGGNPPTADLSALTAFQQAVLRKAMEIPRGEVRPYGWIAREIGRPRAVRAVGSALAHNPVPLIIPCHRVVRSDGTIGQYSMGGPERKRALLTAEGVTGADLAGVRADNQGGSEL